MSVISSSRARACLPEVLDRVAAGEEVVITRHGQPVAVVIRPDSIRARRGDRAWVEAGRIRDVLEAGKTARLLPRPGLDGTRAEELIAEIRAGRDRD